MVRLFQAARLSVSTAKMWPQLAGGRKAERNRRHIGAEITDKNVLYCRGGGRLTQGMMKESSCSAHKHIPACV